MNIRDRLKRLEASQQHKLNPVKLYVHDWQNGKPKHKPEGRHLTINLFSPEADTNSAQWSKPKPPIPFKSPATRK